MDEDTFFSFSWEPSLDRSRLEAGLVGVEGLRDFLVLTEEESLGSGKLFLLLFFSPGDLDRERRRDALGLLPRRCVPGPWRSLSLSSRLLSDERALLSLRPGERE